MAEEDIEKRIEIYKGLEGEVVFDVDAKNETIWATRAQIAQIFGVTPRNISDHLNNIYETGELQEKRTRKKNFLVRTEGKRTVRREVDLYNLDVIISVGYRVNSKKATNFRIWATSVLKKFVTDGVAVNERRLEAIVQKKEVKKLRDVEEMMALVRRLTARNELDAGEANGVLEVISKYAGSFKTLEEYDDGHIDLSFMGKKKRVKELTVEMCVNAVDSLRANVGGSDLFGKERSGSFEGSLAAIFQSFEGKDLYPSTQAKAANLLYFVIKDHPFYDGNKRIGSLLFILFLTLNDCHLTESGETKISDRALTAIALLIAESEPKEKELIVSLVCKLLE
ncbi:virulence protein RhuM/Fic/DOC family protein [Candidatus Saccharibacteria bacterium]|nr:virulence protein RhuM/Fic/DOC family protein [Candidatus Saccharibacteria bacterium]